MDAVVVTDEFRVAGQVRPADVAELARQGVQLLINNRPDGEEPGQPSGSDIEAAATAAGVRYLALPVRGFPTGDQVSRTGAALDEAAGPALAFCRSGMRSILTWALAEQTAGRRSRDDLVELARAAGYDLAAHLPR